MRTPGPEEVKQRMVAVFNALAGEYDVMPFVRRTPGRDSRTSALKKRNSGTS